MNIETRIDFFGGFQSDHSYSFLPFNTNKFKYEDNQKINRVRRQNRQIKMNVQ